MVKAPSLQLLLRLSCQRSSCRLRLLRLRSFLHRPLPLVIVESFPARSEACPASEPDLCPATKWSSLRRQRRRPYLLWSSLEDGNSPRTPSLLSKPAHSQTRTSLHQPLVPTRKIARRVRQSPQHHAWRRGRPSRVCSRGERSACGQCSGGRVISTRTSNFFYLGCEPS